MTTRTHEDFQRFLSQLLETNADLAFYTDFEKCYANVKSISIKLNQLNYLIGKTDTESAIRDLWAENSKVFEVLGILIATRDRDNKKVINASGEIQLITDHFRSPEGVVEFVRSTGLEEVFRSKHITNLVDYVFGVEVGLDTNARKNRSGHIMEHRVDALLTRAGVAPEAEVYSTDLPGIGEVLGEDTKRFDFVVRTKAKTYLMEVNFYSGGGSKLNEVARAYTELAPKVNAVPGYEFVWITDGSGWNSAKGKLEEAFYAIPRIYNLTTIQDFIRQVKG